MITAGLVITCLVAAGIIGIGVAYLTAPRRIAAGFGLPNVPPADLAPWLHLKGVRDVAFGLVAVVVVLTAPAPVVGWVVLAATAVPLGDAVTVLRAGGDRRAALAIHGATALLMLVGALLLLLGAG